MKNFTKWASKEYSFTQRLLGTLPAGILFALLIPYTLVKLIPPLDTVFHLPRLSFGSANIIVGCILIIVGLTYAFWSIISQFTQASGTPLPIMATQKLLVSGPFSQCRNPMTFGTILLYAGISILVRSVASLAVVLLFTVLLLIYIKRIEERELEARFGQEYAAYKATTPFIIPRLISRQR